MQCHSNLQFLDSRPRACSHPSLFVRQTPTHPCAKGQKPDFTQCLVRSVRCGSRVRQRTLRNLGRHVALPRGDGPALCARVERILAPQRSLERGACCPAVEDEAQRSAAQLVQASVSPVGPAAPADGADDPAAALPRVDVDSLELVRPRSVGVEHVALGELLGCDCETMGRNALQRASDRLLRHRDTIETRLLQRAAALFDLQPTVTLHDRTSTCCEGAADRQPLARRGHSREKRHDCPPLTLGLALDASGFARRSRVLAGNVAEGGTLQATPTALDAPPEAVVVLDRGLATEGNVAWLRERGHQCLVASRERRRVFDESRAVVIGTAGGQRVLACAETDGNGETRLRCASAQRAEQAGARLETALRTLHEGLSRQGTTRRVAKVWQRIGRLQTRHPSAAPHDAIDVQADDRGRNATAVAWKRQPLEGGGATHPGVHGLRANSVGWDAGRLWRACVTRTDLEAVLRSLKSELGLRPIHHHKPKRSAGHLCLSVLAYQLVQVVRQRLRAGGATARWTTLRRRLAGQQRVTAVFRQADGRMLPVRKATRAESWQRAIQEWLDVDASPGGVRKLVVQPRRRREHARNAVPHA